MLKVENINMSYGDLQVLWDVSFHVNEGEIVVLVGANGAGKSSVLKTISGLQAVSSGMIEYDGIDLTKIPPAEIIKKGVVHVPEARRLFNEMTVEENLIMGSLHGDAKTKRNETMERCYELFPRLKERRKQLARTLSGGEQQMLAIGRGLMSRPKLLLLDELSMGLAPSLVKTMGNIIVDINRRMEVSILLVEQNAKIALAISKRSYLLETGRIILEGESRKLLTDEIVKKSYLGI